MHTFLATWRFHPVVGSRLARRRGPPSLLLSTCLATAMPQRLVHPARTPVTAETGHLLKGEATAAPQALSGRDLRHMLRRKAEVFHHRRAGRGLSEAVQTDDGTVQADILIP